MTIVCVFAIAVGAAWTGTAGSRALAHQIGLVSRPNPIVPQHVTTVAYLGGLGVVTGLFAVFCATALFPGADGCGLFVRGQLAGALSFLVLGIVDDARPLTPRTKFMWQALLAALFVWLNGGWQLTGIGFIDAPLTVCFILVVVNAVNLTDVCDGLVAGIATICAVTFLGLMESSTILPAAIAGSCLGFLTLNAPPARIFLGDAGSHLLGFLLSALAIEHMNASSGPAAIAASLLALGVFLFELTFLVVGRARKGIPWWRGSPDHFALRLQAAGVSRWGADTRAWIAASVLGIAALAVERLNAFSAGMVVAGVLLGGLGIGIRLLRTGERMTVPATPVA